MKKFALILLVSLCFCSCKKGCTYPNANNYDPDASRDDGSCEYDGIVTFWTSSAASPIIVSIDGDVKFISEYYTFGISDCAESGCAIFNLEPGSHSFHAERTDGTRTWDDFVGINSNSCLLFELQ